MSKSFPSLVPSQKLPAWGSAHSEQFSSYPRTWQKQVQNEMWSWSRTQHRSETSEFEWDRISRGGPQRWWDRLRRDRTEPCKEKPRPLQSGLGSTGSRCRQTDKDNDSSQGKARLKAGIGVTSPPPNTANQTGGSGWWAILVGLLASDKGQLDHRMPTALSEGT